MNVQDVMTRRVISVGYGEPVSAAVRLLQRHNLGALPVCDAAGRLRGMVTDRDVVMRCLGQGDAELSSPVSEIMSRGIVTAAPHDDVSRAAQLMARDRVRRLPVAENGRLVGMVTLADLVRRGECEMECAQAIRAIVSNVDLRAAPMG